MAAPCFNPWGTRCPQHCKGGFVAPHVPGDVECLKHPHVGDKAFLPVARRQVPSEARTALLGTAQAGRCSLSACALPARSVVCTRQEMSGTGWG